MKIKPQPRKKARVNFHAYHPWLVDEKPRPSGALAQLTKRNKRNASTNRLLRIAEGSAEREERNQ